ncbi:MMPL family transporter [uncultured Paraglaciecola sp.]|uniref:efflux RND transporter permease subunit n=1 Tax=uncultured Paraglaciecola sp. TaxID=1765024 RepID=UPI00260E7CFC|nr:MMPL family transporter [uncultured Paraglaciecola sp.]
MNNQDTVWLTKKPRLVVIAMLILTLSLGWFAQHFKIDASAETLLVKDNELYIQSQLMNERFSPDEFILLAYEPKEHDVFSEQTFTDIQILSKKLQTIPRVRSVTHILNVPLLSQMSSLDPNLNPNEWTWQSKQFSYQQMRQIFENHPIFTDLLVNKAKSATSIQIVFKKNKALSEIDSQIINLDKKRLTNEFTDKDEIKVAELKAEADPIRQTLNKQREQEIAQIYKFSESVAADANIYLGGSYVLGHQLVNIIRTDLKLFGSAIGLTICVMLLILFREWRWVLIPIVCCLSSVVMTIGLFGIFDLRTTVISSNFIALQLILTLAISVHIIVQYRQYSNDDPEASQAKLITKTLKQKIKPCFYAGITTSVGFGSLIFSGIQPVVSFGFMMIIAMFVSIMISLIFLPALLSLFPRSQNAPLNKTSQKFIEAISSLTKNHTGKIISAFIVLVVLSIFGLFRLSVENSFLNYFAEDTKAHQELTFIDQQFGGSTPFDIVIDIPQNMQKTDLALSAESIQQLQVAQTILNQYPASGNTTSVVNFTELALKLNQGQPLTEYELTAIYNLVDENLRKTLLGSYFSIEHQQLRLSSRVKDSTQGFNRKEYLENLRQELETNGIPKEQYQLTNLFVLYQDILQRLFKSQILTLGIVYIALLIVMWILFKRFSIALVALVPNIICTLLILAVMGIANIPLDLMTITIAAIAMGIAVDDTIHFVHHYLYGDKDPQKAINKAYFSVGYAMLFTTLIICTGFALLAFSDFVPSMLFGLLTSLAMLFALITDLTLLPALLTRFIKPIATRTDDIT